MPPLPPRMHPAHPLRTPVLRGWAAALCATFFAVLSPVLLAAQEPAAMAPPQEPLAQRLPVDPAVRMGRLDNGLTWIVRAHGEPRQRAELRLVVNAGSVLEAADQRGLAHFLEHMAFNGTQSFPRQALVNYLEGIGMRFGPDLNAYTSFDETVYLLQLPTDDPALLRTGLHILEEWAHRITLDPAEVEKERGVILEEWRLGRGAQARVLDRQIPLLFAGSPYAERLPIGDTAVLRTAPVEALERFYRDWYRPDLMAVVAVGDFDADEVEALIRERFAHIPPHPAPLPRPRTEVPAHSGTLFALVQDPELQVTQIGVAVREPRRETGSLEAYRGALVEALYGSMFNLRLEELTRSDPAPFLGAAAFQGEIVREAGLRQLAAIVESGGAVAGLEALLLEAQRLSRFGFTPSELEREKEALVRQFQRAFDERERRRSGALADEYVRHFLTGEPIPGIEAEFQLLQALLPTIDLEAVNQRAHDWVADEDRILLISAPEAGGAPLPAEDELLAAFARAGSAQLEAWADAPTATALVATPPSPGTVVSEVREEALGVTIWTLSNGVRVLLRPTDFKDDEILVQAWAPGGVSLAPDDDLVAARTATAVVGQGGLGELSLTELQRVLAGKVAAVTPSISELSQGISGSASPRDVETLFQLIHLTFTAPRADRAAFAALQTQLRAVLANRDASPQAHFQDTLAVTMAQGHPRARPAGPGYADAMDLDRSLAFYRARFADAAGFTFALVGSFDPAEMRPLVETWLGSLPSTRAGESWRDDGVRPPSATVRKIVRKGVEPQSLTQLLFTGEGEYSTETRDRLDALGQILELTLRESLREELGGTYDVSASGRAALEPVPSWTVAIGFGSAPDRVDELLDAVAEAIERLKRDGPTQEDLFKVKEAHRRARETGQRQNAYWLGQLLNWDRFGGDAERITAPSLLDGMTAEDVREAARTFLPMDRLVIVTLLPEEGR